MVRGLINMYVGWWCSERYVRRLVLVVFSCRGSVRVGVVVEYMSDSWYWWCYHTEGQCGWVGGVVEYMSDSCYWWCYHTEGQCGWVGGVVEYMSDSWYWWCYHTEGQCGLVV